MAIRAEEFRVDVHGVTSVRLINRTGAPSVTGQVVRTSQSEDYAVETSVAAEENCIGAMIEDGIPDGNPVWIGIVGPVPVLLEDGTPAGAGYWAKTSDTQPGRVDASNPYPPAATGLPKVVERMRGVGYVVEERAAGTDVLCRIMFYR